MSDYVIDEEKVEKMLRHLRIHKPEKATREYAIKRLAIMHTLTKKIAIDDPEFAEELERALMGSDENDKGDEVRQG